MTDAQEGIVTFKPTPQVARLRVLADILEEKEKAETLKIKSAFYMGDWMSVPLWYGPDNGSDDKTVFEGEEFILKTASQASECGTQLCVAGFATLEAGYSVKYAKAKQEMYGGHISHYISATYFDPKGEALPKGVRPSWELIGAEVLGLNPYHAHVLFFSTEDDGEQAIEILTKLALGVEITDDEWLQYKRNHNIDNMYEGYAEADWSGPYAGDRYACQRDWEENGDEEDWEERCNCGCMDD